MLVTNEEAMSKVVNREHDAAIAFTETSRILPHP
jgi:hypothetical protein